ncbi:MAG TPA: transcriptional regulator [Cyanobacteria bacterium UBA11049]|nr:transcriptional regulator [Cyanobacteria bacterium UBA11049]
MSLLSCDLHGLFHQLAIARNEHELRSHFMDTAGELFAAKFWGVSVVDDNHNVVACEMQGLSDYSLDEYNSAGGTAADPVMRLVIERHAPAHNLLISNPEDWPRSSIYQHVGLRYGIEHMMIAPLVGSGQLIGKIFVMRGRDAKPFNAEDSFAIGAICIHLSTCMAKLQIQPKELYSPPTSLTCRELQIAELVAQGLNNVEIGVTLGITRHSVKQALKRMFRKLDVSARAELVAKIYSKLNF